jgi:eukaryotic-like serine/threonine-protein kinase
MPVDPKRVQAVFLQAIAAEVPADRAAVLDRECAGDLEIRHRVEALLRPHDQPDSYLDQPIVRPEGPATVTRSDPDDGGSPGIAAGTVGASTLEMTHANDGPDAGDDRPLAEGPGSRIGPYKLLQQIGEGGMGVVYMADQDKPVQRKVALKIIKPGMDSGQVVARFEAERQALALKEYPNIAKVLDAGATDTGRPFFVMELVNGIPITDYCDQAQLTPRERLELFVPVCRAIQHAHQKGIIHRDVKPSNALVTLVDGPPTAKVIDFGVAKAPARRSQSGRYSPSSARSSARSST